MRIAILTVNYFPLVGGAEVFAGELAQFLVRRGHAVDVITERADESLPEFEVMEGINVYRVSFTKIRGFTFITSLLSMLRTLWRLDRRVSYDLIHSIAEAPTSQVGTLFKKWRKRPYLITIQGGHLQKRDFGVNLRNRLLKRLVGWSFRNADGVHAISRMLAEEAKKLGAGDVIILPNGVKPETFKFVPKEEARSKLGISSSEKVIISVSRLIPRKGTHHVIKAFARLLPRFPELRLLIVGDGVWKEELERLARELGVANRVDFKGFVPHERLGEILPAADVFALTPEYEGLGIVFIEALACGVPVVASSVGGILDIIENGRNGFLVPPGDVEKLLDALEKLLTNDDLQRKFREEGLRVVREKFLWENILSRIEELYQSLIVKR